MPGYGSDEEPCGLKVWRGSRDRIRMETKLHVREYKY